MDGRNGWSDSSPVVVQQRKAQRLVDPGVVALAPDETAFTIEKPHELDSGGVEERRIHVDVDEFLAVVLHEPVRVDPVAPVGAECHELRELAVERARDSLHVGARGLGLERFEARQDDPALDGVVDEAVHGENRAQRQHDLGIELQADRIQTRIDPHLRS